MSGFHDRFRYCVQSYRCDFGKFAVIKMQLPHTLKYVFISEITFIQVALMTSLYVYIYTRNYLLNFTGKFTECLRYYTKLWVTSSIYKIFMSRTEVPIQYVFLRALTDSLYDALCT